MTVIASMTMDGKAVIHLDRWGERGVTLQAIAQDEPGHWLVEIQAWGFDKMPTRELQIPVRAKTRFSAVRRAAGALLLAYEED